MESCGPRNGDGLARDAGAKFIVSPGYNEDVVKHCIDIDLPVLPGTVTPSEVTAAENLGLKVTKFFPAAQYGGLNTIKALAAPFVEVAQLGATASRVGKAARARVASVTFYQHTRRFRFLFVTETARFRAA